MLDINNYVLEKCENFAKSALFRIVTRPIWGESGTPSQYKLTNAETFDDYIKNISMYLHDIIVKKTHPEIEKHRKSISKYFEDDYDDDILFF